MENTTVENSKKLAKLLDPSIIQRLEQDAAQRSTRKDEQLYSREDVVKCMSILLTTLSGEMISPDVWKMAVSSALREARKRNIESADDIFSKIISGIISNRAGSLAGALDKGGFW